MRAIISDLKRLAKKNLKKFPIPFSKNHKYDIETRKIVKKICHQNSNCIDVGAHEGEILDIFLKQCPNGIHFGFEPLPHLYEFLVRKYHRLRNVRIYDFALSNSDGAAEFNYVISNPAYSGLRKRAYDRKNEVDTTIKVKKQLLDNLIPQNVRIDMIKVDVEGGEMDVFEGARRILLNDKPALLFEFGIGGSDIYGTTPEKLYGFLAKFNYNIFLLKDFLKNRPPLTADGFKQQFCNKLNYYFFAQ